MVVRTKGDVVREEANLREEEDREAAFQKAYRLLLLAECHQGPTLILERMAFARTPQVVGQLITQ